MPTQLFLFFFFNDTATTEIYTLSLHDALPIFFPNPAPVAPLALRNARPQNDWPQNHRAKAARQRRRIASAAGVVAKSKDRKSTRLNSSHLVISYAVFCLKKKKNSPDAGRVGR